MKKYLTYIKENKENEFYIIFDYDKIVYHITSKSAELLIKNNGFLTGEELGVAEKRKAIFFSDKDVNYGIYARNREGETYEGEEIGEIKINIKGLKLLNMNFKKYGQWINYNKYKDLVVRGDLDSIPLQIDGTISFLSDGRIYEVCLKKEVANRVIVD